MKKLRNPDPLRLEKYAYENRRDLTRAEKAMERILMGLGWRFNIEHPKGELNIILDFFVPAKNLIIEVDGSSHIGKEERDRQRDMELVKRGALVCRFTNDQVLKFPRKTRATMMARIKIPVATINPYRVPTPRYVRQIFIPNPPSVFYEAKPYERS